MTEAATMLAAGFDAMLEADGELFTMTVDGATHSFSGVLGPADVADFGQGTVRGDERNAAVIMVKQDALPAGIGEGAVITREATGKTARVSRVDVPGEDSAAYLYLETAWR